MLYAEQNREKWNELERTGKGYVKFGKFPITKPPVDLIFHLEMYPSFDGQTGWTVYYDREPLLTRQPMKGIDACVQRVIWDDKGDRQRYYHFPPERFDSKPTLWIHEAVLSHTQFDAFVDEGNKIPIPLVGLSPHSGRDGADYVLRGGRDLAQYEFRWWSGGPEEWRPFTKWVEKMIFYMEYEISKTRPIK